MDLTVKIESKTELYFFFNYVFKVLGQEKIASLISTDDQSMFVMDNSTMRWATQLPFSPLVIKRGSFVVNKWILSLRLFTMKF